jgi:Outer membrane lipoprotein carrier protein LolA-like
MISGIALTIPLLLTAPALLSGPPPETAGAPSNPPPGAAALIATLARPAPASTAYTEVHFARLLKEPLVLHGELDYGGADKLGKRVDTPYKETTTIADGKATIAREGRGSKTFGLDRAPELQGLLASFSAMLSGDADTMNRYYVIEQKGDTKSWRLTLQPRSPDLAKHLKTIVVDGAAQEPRCFTMTQGNGDASVMLLGDLATTPLSKPITRPALDDVCHAAAQ